MRIPKTTAVNDFVVCGISRDCVKVLDTVGRIVSFNDDGLRLMEIDHFDQVSNVYWPELWPIDVRELASEGLAMAKQNGVATFRAPCPTMKGLLKWWDVTIAAIPGPAVSFAVISRDITLQYAEDIARREKLERLEDIADSNTDVLWDIDLQTNRVWWSEGMQRLLGYRPDQIGDSRVWCQNLIHPEDRTRVIVGMSEAIADGSTFWEDEFRYRAADGSYVTVLDRGSIIRNVSGMGVRFVGVMQDISVRSIKAKTNELMAGELSHRVNNILAIISALFHQSLRVSESLEALERSFGERLLSMAGANKAIMNGSGLAACVRTLVNEQLGPFIGTGRLKPDGPEVTLVAEVALPFALTLNELATNAVKYGALSNNEGNVSISWRWESDTSAIIVDWVETGGPVVTEPKRKGLGSMLIQRSIPRSTVERRFNPGGFSCTIKFSAKHS